MTEGSSETRFRIEETSDKQPVIVLWVPNVDLSFLIMTEEVGGIGISWGAGAVKPVIAGVTRGGAAEQAGVQPGDSVIAVDGVHVSTWDEVKALLSGPVGELVSVTVQRASETQPRTFSMQRIQIGTGSRVDFVLAPKGDDILELKPRGSLLPGMYCLSAGSPLLGPGSIPHWCFIVE